MTEEERMMSRAVQPGPEAERLKAEVDKLKTAVQRLESAKQEHDHA